MKKITVYNHGALPTADFSEFKELQEDFKITNPDKNIKLQMLIITRGFKYSFKAWKDEQGELWIIDAHQRKKALAALANSGFEIPPIPYEPIHAESKQEAVEEIAAYNSEFGTKNADTKLFEKYDIGTDTLDRFELGFEKEDLYKDVPGKANLLDHSDSTLDIDTVRIDTEEETKELPSLARTGDIWLLDYHRVMCGDSSAFNDVKQLMNNRKADLIVTDPPYNVAYEGKTEDALTIQNDSMSHDDFYRFLYTVHQNLFTIMKDGAGIYVFHADTEGENFRRALRESGLKLSQSLVWVKNGIVMGRQDYHWQHEPILYGWKPTAGHKWHGDRKQSTVINCPKPLRNGEHPTMKPVSLITTLILNSSKENDIVVDLFGGSGSTLIACSQNNRISYNMELDPKYTDVEIQRYQALYPAARIRVLREGKEITLKEIEDEL